MTPLSKDVADLDYIDGELSLLTEGAQGQRLDKWLAAQLPQFSRSRLQAWIALGAVEIDEAAVSQKYKLRGNERVFVRPQALEAQKAFVAEDLPLRVLFEDESLLVLNKPAGLVVHPAPGHWSGTLMNGLLHHAVQLFELPRAGIVHRLDKDTAGLMVVAKTEQSRQTLIQMIAARLVSRRYLAFVQKLSPNAFTVDAAVGRDPRNRQRMAAFPAPGPQAKPAKTDFRKIAQGEACQSNVQTLPLGKVSVLECRLHSGRTHQIRVHAAFRSHPLVGDTLYGGPRWPGLDGQALLAWRLSFEHPDSYKPSQALAYRGMSPTTAPKPGSRQLDFKVPLSEELERLAERLGVVGSQLLEYRDQDFEAAS